MTVLVRTVTNVGKGNLYGILKVGHNNLLNPLSKHSKFFLGYTLNLLRQIYTLIEDTGRDLKQKNWVFATNSYFQIPISVWPNDVDLRYFKLWILKD